MKSSIKIVSLAALMIVLYSSCEPNVYFQNTLPPDTDMISEIPEVFQGVYLCDSDNDIIFAESDIIYRKSHEQFVTTLDKLIQTENCSIVDGELFLPNREECAPIEYLDDDRILVTVTSLDTLFAFKSDQVAKIYKDRLFLNVKSQIDQNWITFMITPIEHGILKWEMIEVPDDISTLEKLDKSYTAKEHKDHDTKYVINPTLVEFEDFLNKEYIMMCDILIPIRIENTEVSREQYQN